MSGMTGCSSDDSVGDDGGTTNHPDATGDNYVPPVDASNDTNGQDVVVVTPPDAKIIFVHAAPGIGAVRLCVGVSGTIAPYPPLPDTAQGIPPGTGGAFPDLGVDLSQLTLTPYIVDATKLGAPGASEPTCDAIIGGDGGLTAGVDYWQLADIPPTFTSGNTFLLSLTGCLADTTDAGFSAGQCGTGYDAGGGNLALGVAQLDTSFDAGAGVGIQFAHRSSAIEGLPATADTTALGVPGVNVLHGPASDGVIPGVLYTMDGGPDGESGQAFLPIDTTPAPVKFSSTGLDPSTGTVSPVFNQADPASGFAVITTPGSGDGGAIQYSAWPGGDLFGLPLTVIQQFTTGTAPTGAATMFTAGETYTFVLLGDPTKTLGAGFVNDAGQPDFPPGNTPTQGLHFIAFPNHIAVQPIGTP